MEHIAIIMDGNGRWAENKGLKRIDGHNEGAKRVRDIMDSAIELGVKYITLYAFSTENWKRSPKEVKGLMDLLNKYLVDNVEELDEKGVSLRAIGELDKLPFFVKSKLSKGIEKTKNNDKAVLTLALSYGGRREIINATKQIAELVKKGELKIKNIDEELFQNYLYDSSLPDPDLLIRTSGEQRLSNFLLWQLSYSELYVTDVLWPDFDKKELKKAINFYNNRDRRFGGRKK